ncbi:beta-lactamase-like protein [Xylaria bambusicola]|uniref:beta-lactamase-like protein n=1 Tax=Xylaria bambusicola TaxID=326684 RepID=UPI00200757E7|nr:beta-lactamase-like protein [Xylaria bambusicola]KAI0505642.1 beta-lactamase-like protein [Xylaria bambusicola]
MSPENKSSYSPQRTGSWLVCKTCGTQFPTDDKSKVTTCFICDDPRQYVPPSGQSFTSLSALRSSGKHKNVFTPIAADPEHLVAIATSPKVGIGQRAILVRTGQGNVLWDCITLLDDETIARVNDLGGINAIVISHPHYYSTHLEWARVFDCPVYLAGEDKEWLAQRDSERQIFVSEVETQVHGTTVLKLGGHFPGSLVMLYEGKLLIADTFFATPSGLGNWDADALGAARGRPAEMSSFAFMWSYPNMIPLAPDALEAMWAVLKRYEFGSTHGAFPGMDIVKTPREMKKRVLESMQIQIRYSGHGEHAMLKESIA